MQVNQSLHAPIHESPVKVSPGKMLFAAWSAIALLGKGAEAKDQIELKDAKVVVMRLSHGWSGSHPYIITDDKAFFGWTEEIPECLQANFGHLNPAIAEKFSTKTTGTIQLKGELILAKKGKAILVGGEAAPEAVEALKACAEKADIEYLGRSVLGMIVLLAMSVLCITCSPAKTHKKE